jgi:glycosyltransferase involved in cell wall biosynthesis
MRCPRLAELPMPPEEKSGWPWVSKTAPLAPTLTDNSASPRVTIVTPSFNQARFLEETIRSVLLQGYPNLEYIVIDGGSSDESVDIIQKYGPWLAHWESKPDRGQSHAINKGFERATGEIVAWINSDDFYYPGAIATAVHALARDPSAAFVYSDCTIIDTESRATGSIDVPQRALSALIGDGNAIAQPTVFMRRDALLEVGPVRVDLHMVMDYDLWIRLLRVSTARYLPGTRLAAFRMYPQSKTVGSSYRAVPELLNVFDNLFRDPSLDSSLRAVRRRAYGRVYLQAAIVDAERQRAFPSGLWWYAKSVLYHHRLALARPLAPLWFLRESVRQTIQRLTRRSHAGQPIRAD